MSDSLRQDFWRCVRRGRHRRPIDDAGFVLTALGIEHHIGFEEGQWCVWVPLELAERAEAELDSYQRENARGRGPAALTTIDNGWAGVIAFLCVIWALPTLEAHDFFGWAWREAGHMHAGRVMDGEWWRTVTALTLHGDIGHIIGNSVFGALFGFFLGRHMGSGLAWLLVVICGGLGNGLNAWLQADAFRSVGASTATFAAVGLLASFVWRRGYYRNLRWQRSFAPIAAAIALLAFTGIGDETTDVVAHFTGFGFGIVAGQIAARFDVALLGTRGQAVAGAAALGIIALAWILAGNAATAL